MSAPKSNIEILVVNHKPSYVPQNELLKPIQVGTALAAKKLPGMTYYDNAGENISEKNRSYCELTATYWAWKNLDADYLGLFHYRRYFSFSPKQMESPYGSKAYPSIALSLADTDINDADKMREIIEQYDIVIPREENIRATNKSKTIYDHYEVEHYISDLDYCLDYVKTKYPEIAPYASVLHEDKGYFCNMFIAKKDIFHEYCEFMFDVLEDFEANNDISGYSVEQHRVTGYLAERLTNMFIHYLQGQKKYKIKELQMVYFENTDPSSKLSPVAKQDNVGIVLASNDLYIPYMSTLIHSIAEHASAKNTYDITIFHQDIRPRTVAILQAEFAHHKNFNIRFYDMSSRASEYSKLFTKWHFTVETYFRLFIQDIMADYDKVLYLDGDMIVRTDVAELYNTDVTGYLLAACRDIDMAGVYNSNSVEADNVIDPKRKNYIDNELNIKDPYGYFQAGVILFNLEAMRKVFNTKAALTFAASRQWEYLDQDVLNYFAQGNVKYLDLAWNVLYDWEFVRIKNVISKAPIPMYLDYMQSRQDPKIIHYGGTIKPWHRPDCDYGELYWQVARKSEFYELILARMGDWRTAHPKVQLNPKYPLRVRAIHASRHLADVIAPAGTWRRRPITLASQTAKKILFR